MVTLKPNEIAAVAKEVGFSGDNLVTAVAIALAESGGNVDAINHNLNGTTDYGLWQINSVHSNQFDMSLLSDNPIANGKAAFVLSASGTNFQPWSTYTNKAYLVHVPAARDGVAHMADTGSSTLGNIVGSLPGAGIGKSVASTAKQTGKLLSKLLDAGFWKRVGIIALGLFVLMLGFVLMIGSNREVQKAAETAAVA